MHSVLFLVAAWCCSLVLAHDTHIIDKRSHQRLPRQGARLDRHVPRAQTTLRCESRTSFSLCDGSDCTFVGNVAAGTACVDNSIMSEHTSTHGRIAHTKTKTFGAATRSHSSSDSYMPTAVAQRHAVDSTASESYKFVDFDTTAAQSEQFQQSTIEQPAPATVILDSNNDSHPDASTIGTAAATSTVVTIIATSSSTSSSSTPSSTQFEVMSAKTSTTSVSSQDVSGSATFYYQGGAAGACGNVHSDSDMIVALQTSEYAGGKNCGRSVTITNTANGKKVTATVADLCPGCRSTGSLDLSQAAFDAIGSEASGVLEYVLFRLPFTPALTWVHSITWHYNS